MNDKDKVLFDALMQQSEFFVDRFDGRREFSWKVTLGFWAAILGSVAVLKSELISLSVILLGLSALAVAILHFYWLKKVFEADKFDKLHAFEFRDKAIGLLKSKDLPKDWPEDLLKGLSDKKKEFENREFIEDWSFQFQFSTTAILLMAIVLYLVR